MKRVKLLFLAFAAVSALVSVMAASASAAALPTLLFLTGAGNEGPTVLFNTLPSKIFSQIQTETAKPLENEGLNLELTFLNLNNMSKGEYLVRFLKVKTKTAGEECETAGTGLGNILIHGTINLVYDSLSPLGVGTLFEIPETTIKCFKAGVLEKAIKVKGSVLGLVKPINTWVEKGSNTIEVLTRCSSTAGKPAETRYWNDSGVAQGVSLEVEIGKGFEEGCELVGGNASQVVTLLPTKMVEIDG